MSKAWFVTGASSGMGRGLARFAAHLRRKPADANWLKHTLAWLDDAGRLRLGYRPVHLQLPPKERVY
jgi:succinate dehydrogenase / fumarate reductase flavoprotein subunit